MKKPRQLLWPAIWVIASLACALPRDVRAAEQAAPESSRVSPPAAAPAATQATAPSTPAASSAAQAPGTQPEGKPAAVESRPGAPELQPAPAAPTPARSDRMRSLDGSAWIKAGDGDSTVLNQPATEDIELQMNADVVRYIEFFTGAGRSTFERWMKRSGRYMDLFRTVLQREGLPPDLVHLVFVESGFNLNARSVASAVGPWQMLKGSARLFGLNVNQWVDERKDPEKATVAAARYLKHLYGIFGDWPLALASYNAGEGTVLRAIRAQGTTNYWDLKLPRATEDYVPQFMAALAISRDPARYGFSDLELDDPMRFDEVALKGAVDLRAIARLADCSYEQIKELNPAVRASTARGADGITTVRVPEGKGEVIYKHLADGATLPRVNLTVRHRVRRGETLRAIAAEYSVSAAELARANGVSRRRPLRRGMLLTVPASMHTPTPEILDPASDPRASTAYVPSRTIGLPAKVDGKSVPMDRVWHVVKRHETLAGIAREYGVSVEDLRRWNRIKTAHVRRGTRLRIRSEETRPGAPAPGGSLASNAARDSAAASRDSVVAAAVSAAPIVHVVEPGETLNMIAARYNVTLEQLRAWNHLSRRHRLMRGQRLTIRSPYDAVAAVAADPDAPATDGAGGHAAPIRVKGTHTVQPGETLTRIAEANGVSVSALKRANGLRTTRIHAGQKLRLPA